jgi:hypothetical protein
MVCGLCTEKKGPFGAMLKSSGSRHSMSRTYGPRDMISLVTPRFGGNIWLQLGTCADRRAHENLNISGVTCSAKTQHKMLVIPGVVLSPLVHT